MRIVYYCFVVTPNHETYMRQWVGSIRSLRQHNRTVPVRLYVFNSALPALRDEAARNEVTLIELGNYAECLSSIAGQPGAVLSNMPALGKLLPLGDMPGDASQILFADCDTFFFRDVERLFVEYAAADFYAREEPNSRRSVLFPYNPAKLDEDVLERISAEAGCRFIAPFNSGVVLFNHGIWKPLYSLSADYFRIAWKLTLGARRRGTPELPPAIVRHLPSAEAIAQTDALDFPGREYWTLGQTAMGIAMGMLPGLTSGCFPPSAVLQNGEFALYRSFQSHCILAHYFTPNESDFFARVSRPSP